MFKLICVGVITLIISIVVQGQTDQPQFNQECLIENQGEGVPIDTDHVDMEAFLDDLVSRVDLNTRIVGVTTCIRSGTLQAISFTYEGNNTNWEANVVGPMQGSSNIRGNCDTWPLTTEIQSITAYWSNDGSSDS